MRTRQGMICGLSRPSPMSFRSTTKKSSGKWCSLPLCVHDRVRMMFHRHSCVSWLDLPKELTTTACGNGPILFALREPKLGDWERVLLFPVRGAGPGGRRPVLDDVRETLTLPFLVWPGVSTAASSSSFVWLSKSDSRESGVVSRRHRRGSAVMPNTWESICDFPSAKTTPSQGRDSHRRPSPEGSRSPAAAFAGEGGCQKPGAHARGCRRGCS
jgi:hypothetical protein